MSAVILERAQVTYPLLNRSNPSVRVWFKLREAEVALSKDQTVVQVSRNLRITEHGEQRNELLNGEIFETRWEAAVLIERWRRPYNQIRPHSALDYQPLAPEARELQNVQCAETIRGWGTIIGGRSRLLKGSARDESLSDAPVFRSVSKGAAK